MRRIRKASAQFWIVNDLGRVRFMSPTKTKPEQQQYGWGYYYDEIWSLCAYGFTQQFKARISEKPIRVRITIERLPD